MKQFLGLIFLHYLRILAKVQLVKIGLIQKLTGQPLTIIGITGSAGKSSTLLALESALSPNFKVKTNYGANSESGIPLNILGLQATDFTIADWIKIAVLSPLMLLLNWQLYQIYILEMGIDAPFEPKNMSYLLKIVQPHIGIFLNVNSVHSQNFDYLVDSKITGTDRISKIVNKIAQEKSRLINSLTQSDTAIINLDDPNVSATTQTTIANKLTISNSAASTLKIISSSAGPQGFDFKFKFQNKTYQICLPSQVLPEIYSVSFASAFLAAATLKLDPQTIISNLESHFHNPPSRSTLLQGIYDSLIIDSSYNSSPTPTIEMLKLLSNFPSPRIAVLGDMRELGNQSPSAHEQIFNQAKKSSDLVIGIGPESTKYFKNNPNNFQYWWQAETFLKDYLSTNPKSTLLIKGSQNTIFLEELVKALIPVDKLDEYLTKGLICRQTPYWLKLKTEFKNK